MFKPNGPKAQKVCNTPEVELTRLKEYKRNARISYRSLQRSHFAQAKFIETLIARNREWREENWRQRDKWWELKQRLSAQGNMAAVETMLAIDARQTDSMPGHEPGAKPVRVDQSNEHSVATEELKRHGWASHIPGFIRAMTGRTT